MEVEFRHRAFDMVSFVIRCAGSATLAYLLALVLQLPHPVWASMSALIVSQENIHATRDSMSGRIIGTLLGALIALIVHRSGLWLNVPLAWQLALAVGICAVIAKGRPTIRVCLWTAPLVLLTSSADVTPELTALFRTGEVLLGVLIGGGLHFAEASLMTLFKLGRYRHIEEQPALPAKLFEAHQRGVLQHRKDVARDYRGGQADD